MKVIASAPIFGKILRDSFRRKQNSLVVPPLLNLSRMEKWISVSSTRVEIAEKSTANPLVRCSSSSNIINATSSLHRDIYRTRDTEREREKREEKKRGRAMGREEGGREIVSSTLRGSLMQSDYGRRTVSTPSNAF